ncbi:unnamed protein product [Medioppia subpectinata]|uniref:Heparinase II/III-like C-terminal domain-containing protein n=1 Tax=Medioppia subpectinata TaxID=1979941 RepID=A0A7R9KJM8_9ACAR|nr:unnamed protein product [Medioppia subpectinata]CAG2104907.1 unnamed protein product [Medioppia subpectinata]
MFKVIAFCLTVGVLGNVCAHRVVEDRDYVLKAFQAAGGFDGFQDIQVFRDNYKKSVDKSLAELPANIKQFLITKADKSNGEGWVSKLASQYLEFVTTGNRVHFETTDTNRRVQLVNLVIGELLTRNGTYMKQIVNGLWLILEESSWETPAHMNIQKAGPGLPDPEQPIIDLRVSEMVSTVAIIKLLLREELTKMNKQGMFIKRIDHELKQRLILPYLNYDDYFWLGLKGNKVNNHNSWINSNILRAALLAIDDRTARHQVVNRSIYSIDKFINWYPRDGGCDEGPTYWGWAGGRLVDYLELLGDVSGGKIDWSTNKLLDLIGTFIYKVHIADNRYVNFADAHAVVEPEQSAVYKYGHLFKDETMKHFAAYVGQREDNYESVKSVSDFLGSLSIFVSTLVSYARGGTNDESHNHNDVGNYIVYVSGKPFIIDVGVGVYTNETFAKDRYKIWSMQSQWHNCPTINGVMQKNGKQYVARDVVYKTTADTVEFSADIAGAYPSEAAVKSYKRHIVFDRKLNTITVRDDYELKKWLKPLNAHFITHLKSETRSAGSVVLTDADNTRLAMKYESDVFDVVVDTHVIDKEDTLLRDVWGDSVHRITLVDKQSDKLKSTFVTTFSLP